MSMNLPYSEKLNIQALQRIFDDKAECYKLFWFKAILRKVREGKQRITYNELVSLMMADAYYMVNEYHLNLGPNDSLEKIVQIISAKTGMKATEKTEKIYEVLLDYRDKEITRLRSNLIANVPYCLQSTFLDDLKISDISTKKDERLRELNRQKRMLYYYGEYMMYDTEIIIDDEWYGYLTENREILEGWVQYNLIEYLQRRNPTIPGIPNKIAPPEKRELTSAKKFWKAVISRTDIVDCYTGMRFTDENLNSFGQIEIDHFIPWSFVASDEIWNLTPTFKKVNINKSNDLPNMDVDLNLLAHQHFIAKSVAKENTQLSKLFSSFLDNNLNDSKTRIELYEKPVSEKEYKIGITKIIEPLYLSAENAGYKPWVDRIGV